MSKKDRGLTKGQLERLLKDEDMKCIIDTVNNDPELLFQIRGEYFNVYYKRRSIMRFETETGKTYYIAKEYIEYKGEGKRGQKGCDIKEWTEELIKKYKSNVKKYLTDKKGEPKYKELQLQQEIVLQNIKNVNGYTIFDMEYATSSNEMRSDMVAVDENGQLAFIELKYGSKSLSGKSGLIKHYEDIKKFVDKDKISELYCEMKDVLEQLQKLGFVDKKVKIEKQDKIQYILICAKYKGSIIIQRYKDEIKKTFSCDKVEYKFANEKWLETTLETNDLTLKKEDLVDFDCFLDLIQNKNK